MKLAEFYGTPVRILQQSLSPKDFVELQAYYSENSHWTERQELYLAQIAYWVYLMNTTEENRKYKLQDFIFDFDPRDDDELPGSNRQSSKAMQRTLERAAKIYGKHKQDSIVDIGERKPV